MTIETEGLLRSFRYNVNIGNRSTYTIGEIGFNSVSGIGDETDSFEYREGNQTDVVHEYDGLTTLNEVDLEKGYIKGRQDVLNLIRWRYHGTNTGDVIKVNDTPVQLSPPSGVSLDKHSRRTVTITLMDSANQPAKEWVLKDCSCRGLELSDFDAESSDAVIQTFTIKPEGLEINNP